MTIESTTSAVKGGVAKRFAALFVAAATLLAGGVFSVSAAPSALADDAETNVALNAEKGNDNAPDVQSAMSLAGTALLPSMTIAWTATPAMAVGALGATPVPAKLPLTHGIAP